MPQILCGLAREPNRRATIRKPTPRGKPRVTAADPAYSVKPTANGRYLVDQNNAPYLIAGDSTQGLTTNISTAVMPGCSSPIGRRTASTRIGSICSLFFWAHWCGDCKAEVPIIARLRQEFGPQGLVVIGPTQLYGYAAQGTDAAPDQERAYIESVRARYYASLQDMPVPLSKQNFNAYGASTTPTLVVLNRAGQVATYHPGALSYDELRSAVEKAVGR